MDPIKATVVLIRRGNDLLLGEKVAKVGKGCLVAPGGKCEGAEGFLRCAVRETESESGVTPVLKQDPLGWLNCQNLADGTNFVVAVFVTEEFTGTPRDSSELRKVGWYPISGGTIARMMDGDVLWLNYALTNRSFTIDIVYDANWHVFRSSIKLAGSTEAPPE